jgi:hypothetical protein
MQVALFLSAIGAELMFWFYTFVTIRTDFHLLSHAENYAKNECAISAGLSSGLREQLVSLNFVSRIRRFQH